MEDYLSKLRVCLDEIQEQKEVIENIADALKDARLVLTMGNGGSASNAQHFAQALTGVGICAVCLTDNQSLLTALTNDYGNEEALSLQVQSYRGKGLGDAIIGFSVSGNSQNVVAGLSSAHKFRRIALVGCAGEGELGKWADFVVKVNERDFGVVEDTHIILCHIICGMIRDAKKNNLLR